MDVVNLLFIVRNDMPIQMPRANIQAGWITFGFNEDLKQATITALEEMISLIQQMYKVTAVATALSSVVVDLRITQIVNQVIGVHAVLPHGALR